MASGATDDPHGPLGVPHQPSEGEQEAGGDYESHGPIVFNVNGTRSQLPGSSLRSRGLPRGTVL